MNTIRLGSTGDDVTKWQGLIGVTADGSFGANTLQATIDWQRKHKLLPDGIVGPASWGMALGSPVPVVKNGNLNDTWAYAVAKNAAPSMPEPHRQYALAVARGEGRYGKGWGADPALGAGSNNWGAVQGTGDAGAFQHIDHHADGTQYSTNFKRYSTPENGFLDMAHILLKPNVTAALNKGNLHDAVFAQHSNGYFELAPDKYLASVVRNYGQLTTNLGWKKYLAENGISIIGKVLGLVGLGVVLFLFSKGQR